jgi:hypothetical protein
VEGYFLSNYQIDTDNEEEAIKEAGEYVSDGKLGKFWIPPHNINFIEKEVRKD